MLCALLIISVLIKPLINYALSLFVDPGCDQLVSCVAQSAKDGDVKQDTTKRADGKAPPPLGGRSLCLNHC